MLTDSDRRSKVLRTATWSSRALWATPSQASLEGIALIHNAGARSCQRSNVDRALVAVRPRPTNIAMQGMRAC